MIDLEPHWQGRLEDIVCGKTELRLIDLQNTKTSLANHDTVPIEDLLNNFKQIRKKTIDLLENLDVKDVFRSFLHPRMKSPMKTMDLFLFVAEHDDHHLARIAEMVKIINGQK